VRLETAVHLAKACEHVIASYAQFVAGRQQLPAIPLHPAAPLTEQPAVLAPTSKRVMLEVLVGPVALPDVLSHVRNSCAQ